MHSDERRILILDFISWKWQSCIWNSNTYRFNLILLTFLTFGYLLKTLMSSDFTSLLSLCRYVATSCATEQVPSRLWSGPEERPVLRWYPRLQGHMGQLLLCRQSQVSCHHHRGQWGRSLSCPSSTKGERSSVISFLSWSRGEKDLLKTRYRRPVRSMLVFL